VERQLTLLGVAPPVAADALRNALATGYAPEPTPA